MEFRGEAAMSIRVAIFALGCLLLTGCETFMAQQGADAAADAEAQTQARRRNDDAQCRSRGFAFESPDYNQCRKTLGNQGAADQQQSQPQPQQQQQQ